MILFYSNVRKSLWFAATYVIVHILFFQTSESLYTHIKTIYVAKDIIKSAGNYYLSYIYQPHYSVTILWHFVSSKKKRRKKT